MVYRCRHRHTEEKIGGRKVLCTISGYTFNRCGQFPPHTRSSVIVHEPGFLWATSGQYRLTTTIVAEYWEGK